MALMKIFISSDHAGFPMKEDIKEHFPEYEWVDLGPKTPDRVDYPEFADKMAVALKGSEGFGILLCGSGQGVAMRANKYPHIRAALCWNEESAKLARQHNNANVLCMGSRLIEPSLSNQILQTFLKTEFEGGRHSERVAKLEGPLK